MATYINDGPVTQYIYIYKSIHNDGLYKNQYDLCKSISM